MEDKRIVSQGKRDLIELNISHDYATQGILSTRRRRALSSSPKRNERASLQEVGTAFLDYMLFMTGSPLPSIPDVDAGITTEATLTKTFSRMLRPATKPLQKIPATQPSMKEEVDMLADDGGFDCLTNNVIINAMSVSNNPISFFTSERYGNEVVAGFATNDNDGEDEVQDDEEILVPVHLLAALDILEADLETDNLDDSSTHMFDSDSEDDDGDDDDDDDDEEEEEEEVKVKEGEGADDGFKSVDRVDNMKLPPGHTFLESSSLHLQKSMSTLQETEQQEAMVEEETNGKTADRSFASLAYAKCRPNVNTFASRIDTERALHRACQLFPQDIGKVKAAFKLNPLAIRRKAFIDRVPSQPRKFQDAIHRVTKTQRRHLPHATPEPFQLPINIALYHNASLQVLDFLVQNDPSMLSVKDGIHGINSLCLALDRRPNDIACLGLLLVSNPDCVKLVCKNIQEITPLHVACQKRASLQVIRQLVQIHPLALMQKSEHGLLSEDIVKQQLESSPTAVSSTNCTEVLDFFREKGKQFQKS